MSADWHGAGAPPRAAGTPQSHVLLVGLPGSGKTVVASGAAAMTGCDAVDLDVEIERIAGTTVREIFAQVGEPGFRRFEVEATRGLLSRSRPAVVATGGGWIANARARRVVPPGWSTIYLRVSPRVAADRLSRDRRVRPLLAGAASEAELAGLLEQMAQKRVPLYERAATTIDTEAAPLDEVVRRVAETVAALRGRTA